MEVAGLVGTVAEGFVLRVATAAERIPLTLGQFELVTVVVERPHRAEHAVRAVGSNRYADFREVPGFLWGHVGVPFRCCGRARIVYGQRRAGRPTGSPL